MFRKGKRFGIRTNATLKYCPICEFYNENCRNWVIKSILDITKTSIEWQLEQIKKINMKYKGCKNSHGRCCCNNSPSLPFFAEKDGGWTLLKSKGKSKGYKRQFARWFKNEIAQEV